MLPFLEFANIGRNKPCNNIPNKTIESLATKFLKPGTGTGTGPGEEEEEALRWIYAPGPPLKLKGSTLDVIPFLSNSSNTSSLLRYQNGNCKRESFNVLRGKHVLICCVSLPVSDFASELWFAINAARVKIPFDELEIVVVPLTGSDFNSLTGSSGHNRDQDLRSLKEFLSETPGLSVPFSDRQTRLNICYFPGMSKAGGIGMRSILVDPSGRILHHITTEGHFLGYGSSFFPFLDSHIKSIDAEDEVLRCRFDPFYRRKSLIKLDASLDKRLSLAEDILRCRPSKSLSRICPTAGPPVTVSELSKRHVGLYICRIGDFLCYLPDVHKKCISNGQELEIIVLFMPFSMDMPIVRNKLLLMNSWFNLSIEDGEARRLWRIFAKRSGRDSFIIIPPNCEAGELLGRQLIDQGEEYPFTRKAILERRFTALLSLNPTSWFEGADKKHTCLVRNGENSNVPLSRVRGKKLLLYFDTPDKNYRRSKLLPLLVKCYPEIKAKGWEVVFIPFAHDDRARTFEEMPWLIMPADVAAKRSPWEQFLYVNEYVSRDENCIIALDEDGKIVSKDAHKRLYVHGVKESLFDNDLYEGMADRLSSLRF